MKSLKHLNLLIVGLLFLFIAALSLHSIWSNTKLIGTFNSTGLSLWSVWFPAHALAGNFNLFQNNYAVYPIESNITLLLSPISSILLYVFDGLFDAWGAYHGLFTFYLAAMGLASYLFLRRYDAILAIPAALVFAFNPLTLTLINQSEVALLGLGLFPFWFLAWHHFLSNPDWQAKAILVGVTYGLVLISLQSLNLMLTVLLPYAIFSVWGRLTKQLRLHLIYVGLFTLFLLLLYPLPTLIRATYGKQFMDLVLLQGIGQLGNWELFALSSIGLISAVLTRLPLTVRRLWLGVIIANLIFYWRPELSPLTVLGSLFNVPRNPQLTGGIVYLLPALLGSLVMLITIKWQRLAWGVLLVAMSLIIVSWDVQSTSVTPLPYLDTIQDDPEDYTVVVYPFGVIAQDTGDELFFGEQAGRGQLYMPYHHKRILGGVSHALNLTPYEDSALIDLLTFQPTEQSQAEFLSAVRWNVRRWRVGYIVMFEDELDPEFVTNLQGTLVWSNTFCHVTQEGKVSYWRATWHPAGCPDKNVRLSAAAGQLAAGTGWHPPEGAVRWATGESPAEVTLWINPQDTHLTIVAANPLFNEQTVEVTVEGEILGEIALNDAMEAYTFALPDDIVEGQILITLDAQQSEVVEGRALSVLYESIGVNRSEVD